MELSKIAHPFLVCPMLHQFKLPQSPAGSYLVRLHADVGGRILETKRRTGGWSQSMKHIEHVIRMFDPDYNMRAIFIRRRERR
jgi:hypothetical protein